ncbi:hypothetical protein IMG5_122670 [Ichthyophthirius multifiliis]|uniref:FHA domain protein n=1 Tax=Ichthyophthirius multifiliis TaxID=5932 RepID=G0QVB6_ICHMU|nr:hypothetical protein IMG5_122670 [Ichthyophthirius multifiliis]EGR30834.1 hypothetical protein IMG5_122670 [Ichthyophthirius multifiliis]|eukprot:XP_004032421.1 hypothetical protein IMG5_122670 [Ichthyophthirius multifiliis]
MQQMMPHYLLKKDRIDKFEDYFSFLSNEYPSWVLYENILYPSVSAAFQASRSTNQQIRLQISQIDSPEELWEIAQEIEDPQDWGEKRLKIMEILLRDKFRRSKELRERLRLTEEKYKIKIKKKKKYISDRQLIYSYENETPSDMFWGVCKGRGYNNAGILLETIRKDISENQDMKKWMLTKFRIEQDVKLLPIITLKVSKNGQQIETIILKSRSYYYLGQYKTCNVLLTHPTVSRLHACFVCQETQKILIIDMDSKSGTFLNSEIIESLHDKQLQNGDQLKFALSTRTYEIFIDYSEANKELQRRKIQLQKDIQQLRKVNQKNIPDEELQKLLGFSINDTLFVSNLPNNTSQTKLKKYFSQYAKVKQVKIPFDKKTGRQKNFAYIIFENQDELRSAHLKTTTHKIKFEGNDIHVKVADKEKSSHLLEVCDLESPQKQKRHRSRSKNCEKKQFRSRERSSSFTQ